MKTASPRANSVRGLSLLTEVVGVLLLGCTGPDTGPTSLSARADAVPVSPAAIVQTVALNYSTPLLALGQAMQLEATLKNAAGEVLNPRAIAWKSSDPSIAQVDAFGLTGNVTAVAPGTTTITGTVGAVSATSVVTVVTFTVVSPGLFVSCAITAEGKLYCAGSNYGSQAQLVAPTIRFSAVS